jgi:hypothetical protein
MSLDQYLAAAGITSDKYNLTSDMPVVNMVTYSFTSLLPPSNQAYRQENRVDPITQGDYVLLTPSDSEDRQSEMENTSNYRLIFRTYSMRYPNLDPKVLLQRLLPRKPGHSSPNIIDPNYYLYERISP